MSATAKARIRQTAIDTMDEAEIRDLVAVMHSKIDVGYTIDEEVFEECIEAVFSTREDEPIDVERVAGL